ncbi:hypothetical protein [Spirosoma montaniterrae]|uniref:Uncharacterized protein n=1 Tax=Spirosoma montaniterrae TaxID=1178516 RepID=A0A1P9WV36_9BACT|nr:hypothetical protein [Spirosoma montaniterrae]AQG79219.1 hypothetical protein AWR27_07700 [Spirosoma montaniterrae]
MNIHAIIHEQIEWDGTAKSFQLKANDSIGDLWVAFPNEYSHRRRGPFYFMDQEYETIFHSKESSCRQVKISANNFYKIGSEYIFKTTWQRVPTQRGELTYYALYLPEFAVPTNVNVTDARSEGREFTKNVFRDDDKHRFVVYVECTSRYGFFDFNINCRFHERQVFFSHAEYNDYKTVPFYGHLNAWKWLASDDEVEQIEQVFVTNHYHNNMGDQYHVNQAGAVGPNSSASGNTFNQMNNPLADNLNYEQLAEELSLLRQALLPNATSPEHYQAIGEVANAELAAKEKNGSKLIKHLTAAGKWVFDFATKVGTSVVTDLIKSQM